MANKKVFTDSSLATFVDEIKAYTDSAVEDVKTFFVEVNKDSGVLASNKSASEITQAFENGMTVVCLYRLNLGDVPSILQLFFCDGAAAIFGAVYGNYITTVTITGTNVTVENINNTVLHEHLANTSNPHGVTKAQVGLENVDNTADMNKPVSNAQRMAINELKGVFEGAISQMYGSDAAENLPSIRTIAKEEVDLFRNEIMEVSDGGDGGTVILPECQPTYADDAGFVLTDIIPITGGNTYTVYWNGVPYSCVALEVYEDGIPIYLLGNYGAIMDSGTPTDEPFMIIALTPEGTAFMGGFGVVIAPMDGTTELTLSITEVGTQKIKPELLGIFDGTGGSPDTLTWDGDTTGKVSRGYMFHVSDLVPTEADLQQGYEIGCTLVDSGRTYKVSSDSLSVLTPSEGVLRIHDSIEAINPVVIVSDAGVGETYPKKGIYFFNNDKYIRTSSFKIIGFTDFGATPKIKEELLPLATTSSSGAMSAEDKAKLDSLSSGGGSIFIDAELSTTSVNPVQNKVITAALTENLDVAKEYTNSMTSGKANASHSHSISDVTNLQVALDEKVAITRTVNGKSLSNNITLSASDVGADASGSAGAVQTNLDTHTSNADVHITSDERTKLSGIESGAQKNTITGVKGDSESSYRTGSINITKANIGLGNVDNTSDANKPVSTAQQSAIDSALSSAKSYTDGKIDALVGTGASTTLDTIGEISAAIEENQDVLDVLNSAIGNKVDKVSGKGLSTNDFTTDEKNKLAGIAPNANNYVHPSSHSATMITEDSAHRFVTDEEKDIWNSAANNLKTASGDFITVETAKESAGALTIHGKTYQKQYTGKNLLKNLRTTETKNGITITVNDDGTVIVNGTATALTQFNLCDFTEISPNTIATGCPSGGNSTTYSLCIGYYDSEKVWKSESYETGSGLTLNSTYKYFIATILIRSGVTVSNLVFKPMIRLASITDDTYEPYVGGKSSPNPDYPQDVNGVLPKAKRTGKNLLSFGNVASEGSGTYKKNADGSSVTVTAQKAFSGISIFMDDKLVVGRTIYIHRKATDDIGVLQLVYSLNKKLEYFNIPIGRNEGYGVSIPEDAKLVRVRMMVNNEATELSEPTTRTFNNVMVTYDKDSTFEPYSESTLSYNTSELYEGDSINGVGKLTRRFRKIVLDGVTSGLKTESLWDTGHGSMFSIYIPDAKNYGNVNCSHVTKHSDSIWSLEVDGITVTPNTKGLADARIKIVKSHPEITTLEQFNAWLKAQHDAGTPVTVVYELATPIEETLTRDGDLMLTKGINHIFSGEEFTPEFDFEYSPSGYSVFDGVYVDGGESLYVGDDVVESAVPINADTLHGYTYEQIISLAGGLPVGSVILWDGDKVPTGWELVEEVTLD